jgi:hypothetical protein
MFIRYRPGYKLVTVLTLRARAVVLWPFEASMVTISHEKFTHSRRLGSSEASMLRARHASECCEGSLRGHRTAHVRYHGHDMTGTTPEIHRRINAKPDSISVASTEADWKDASVGHMHLRFRPRTRVVQLQHQIMTDSAGSPVPRLFQHPRQPQKAIEGRIPRYALIMQIQVLPHTAIFILHTQTEA